VSFYLPSGNYNAKSSPTSTRRSTASTGGRRILALRGASSSAEAEQAVALLRHARGRELTEAGLIAGVPTGAIAQTLRTYLHHEVSSAAITLFASTFFDASAVALSQLRAMVRTRVRIAVARVADPEDEAALRRAIAADARTVAVALPVVDPRVDKHSDGSRIFAEKA
jgi:hypothetical protein